MSPSRNDSCPCGSGKKYKHCCARTAARPVDVVYAPKIDPSLRDLERRQAEFWRPLEAGKVACDLCYRSCEIEDGEEGWCKYRRNEAGRLVIPNHGTVSGIMKEHLGVGDSAYTTYKPGMRGIFVGGIRCTSSCGFCMSKQLVWKPDGVPWVDGETFGPDRLLVNNSFWYGRRARYTPEQIIDNALRVGAGSIELGVNEPLMSIEYSLDVAR
ncbi:MAG TPA: SEC-C metal-binding domain-containing protein, partial [Anaerolineae bacterium]|nr:SEC-C metal-binding domain-containing protein [Anaerolineae bacterium]